MGKFYIYKGNTLLQTGECPDGHEQFQATDGALVGLGIPPESLEIPQGEKPNQETIIRYKRQTLLLECDWTQVADVPAATKKAWKEYRQALRDITEQAGYPNNVVWPSVPE